MVLRCQYKLPSQSASNFQPNRPSIVNPRLNTYQLDYIMAVEVIANQSTSTRQGLALFSYTWNFASID